MKRWISLLAVASLIVSFAAVMNGCGKGGETPAETTESVTAAEELTSRSFKEDVNDFIGEMASELGREDYSIAEHSTDEHYEEDFEALTLPSAVSTTKKAASGGKAPAATTTAVRRETTTVFQFTSPSQPSTTRKAAESTTKKQGGSTQPANAQDTGTSVSDTTVLTERIEESNVVNVSEVTEHPRPNVTYLDKFVINVLNSGSYTMAMEMKADGYAVPVTTYVNGDNYAVKMRMGKALADAMEMPGILDQLGDIRMITKNASTDPHLYFAWSGGYCEIEGAGVESISDIAGEANMSEELLGLLQSDGMIYCGFETHTGYIVESYKVPEENVLYNFYFDSQGLAKWEVVDLSTEQVVQTTTIKLTAGVADKDAFTLKGKKYTTEEMENMFGGMVG